MSVKEGVEGAIEQCGDFGLYQKLVVWLLLAPAATVPASFLVFGHVFATATPDHWCNSSAPLLNKLDNVSSCYETTPSGDVIPCKSGWIYDTTYYDETLVTKFNLVCSDSWQVTLSTSLFYLGSLFGNLLFGWASDRLGRRCVFFPMLLADWALSLASSYPPNFWVYTALRTVRGMFFPAVFQIPLVLCLEMVGPSHRTSIGLGLCSLTSIWCAVLALVSHLLRHWQSLSLVLSFPLLLFTAFFWLVPESPRWLVSKGRMDEAEQVLQRMAKINGRPVPANLLAKLKVGEIEGSGEEVKGAGESSTSVLRVLFAPGSHPGMTSLRTKMVVLMINYTAASIAFYGLAYFAPQRLDIDPHVAFFISAIVEIPGYIGGSYFMEKYGRRPSLAISMTLSGFSCLAAAVVVLAIQGVAADIVVTWTRVGLSMLGKMFCSSTYAVFYVYLGELLPTQVRSQALGVVCLVSGAALLTFPYILSLSEQSRDVPLVVIGCMSLTAGVVSTVLPETLGRPLPQTLDDAALAKLALPAFLTTGHKRRHDEAGGPSQEEQEPMAGS